MSKEYFLNMMGLTEEDYNTNPLLKTTIDSLIKGEISPLEALGQFAIVLNDLNNKIKKDLVT